MVVALAELEFDLNMTNHYYYVCQGQFLACEEQSNADKYIEYHRLLSREDRVDVGDVVAVLTDNVHLMQYRTETRLVARLRYLGLLVCVGLSVPDAPRSQERRGSGRRLTRAPDIPN